jgi:hypothetical protein
MVGAREDRGDPWLWAERAEEIKDRWVEERHGQIHA